jgi:hypothetical protein
LLSRSCHDEPKCTDVTNPSCPNYDPCYGVSPVSASFKILETIELNRGFWKDYETDTVIGGYVKFVADLDGAEYKWTIGAETYQTKSVTLWFANVADRTTIPITLIVKKQPDTKCNPNDDGADTLTKRMYIRKTCKLFSFTEIYRFQGSYTDNPQDTFTMSFYWDTLKQRNNIDNLIRGRQTQGTDGFKGYRQYAFDADLGVVYCSGRAFIKPNDSIEVNYRYSINIGDPYVSKTFLGKKIR